MSKRLVCLLAVVFCLGPGVSHPLRGQELGLAEVTEIRFRGNETFSDEVLARAIMTRETDCRSFVLSPFCWAGADFAQDPYYFSNETLRRDQARIRLFYYQRGYRETAVDTTVGRPSGEGVRIVFDIEEGRPVVVDSLAFQGMEEVSDTTILEGLPLELGDPLSGVLLDATEDSLLTRMKNRGYAHAEVLQGYFIPTDSYRARVTFDLYPGPVTRFGPITVTGNETVSETVVRRMLPFEEGEIYSQDLRFAGRRNLYNLDIFTFTDIVPDTTVRTDSILPFTVRVSEGDVHRVRTGVGLSTADCLNSEVQWASRNFFGGARRLQLTGRVSNVLASQLHGTACRQAGTGEFGELNWLASATFTQPWIFSPRNTLNLDLFGERQSLPDIFVRQSMGLNVGLTHSLTSYMPLTFSLRPQLTSLDAADIFFCSNYLVCAPSDIDILEDANWVSPVGISLSRDRRNQVLSPTRGHSALLDLEYAGDWTGSDFRYLRMLGEATWYHQGSAGWVVATRIRGGWVGPGGFSGVVGPPERREIVHPEKRLYAGGSNSVRGFAQNRLGPRVLHLPRVSDVLVAENDGEAALCTPREVLDETCDPGGLSDDRFQPRPTGGTRMMEGSVEFRVPLASRVWEGAVFLDFGEVWSEEQEPGFGDVRFTPGGGVRYFSPIGPIRVDVAYRFATGENLQVVTPSIEPFEEGVHDEALKFTGPDGREWVPAEELVVLEPRVFYGELEPWSLRRFQLHLTIGQAF